LTAAQIADLCGVSEWTVLAWLKPATSKSHNVPPRGYVELIYLKLGKPLPEGVM
jgi:hypothetical protein